MEEVSENKGFMGSFVNNVTEEIPGLTDQISEEIKQSRLETLIEFQQKISLIRNRKKIGLDLDVIIEKESKKSKNQWAGRTEGNTWVIFDKDNNYKIGDLVKIKILDAQGITLFGSIQ